MALDFSSFVFESVLNTDQISKSMYVTGHFHSDPQRKIAILKVIMPAPRAEDVANLRFGECLFENSMFRKYSVQWMVENTVEVVFPATKAMYLKHVEGSSYMITETREVFERVVAPYIDSIPCKNQEWITNIISGISERENVKFRDEDCVIVQDYKLQEVTKDRFYFLGLPVPAYGLKSMRDLQGAHIPLLRKIREKGIAATCAVTGVSEFQIVAFVHYYPSFYYFHVHFTPISAFQGSTIPRAHLLDSILSCLQRDSTYYATASLPTAVHDSAPFYEQLHEFYPNLPKKATNIPADILSRLD